MPLIVTGNRRLCQSEESPNRQSRKFPLEKSEFDPDFHNFITTFPNFTETDFKHEVDLMYSEGTLTEKLRQRRAHDVGWR
ncbi:hypothetical protein V202x_09250 [Gimesia aquarii]|uniref:Uncharacterized protein n=1 Tax=Gimesia aquarii TaxID=2527964 RepID=A0A517WQN6_9PLAN|nr:hypothetical protein V202x_09250 [Gimesia aquarii]